MPDRARKWHIRPPGRWDCVETPEFWIDLGRFVTWTREHPDEPVDIQRGARGKPDMDPYWWIDLGPKTYFALEVPISATLRGGWRPYYRPKDPSYGLPLPIWQGAELSIFDADPWDRMRKNPSCYADVAFFVAFGDFVRWMQRDLVKHGWSPVDAVAWDEVAASSSTDQSHMVQSFYLNLDWRDTSHHVERKADKPTYYLLAFPIGYISHGSPYYYWRLTKRPATPNSVAGTDWQAPVWTAPNGKFYVYDENPWDDFYL